MKNIIQGLVVFCFVVFGAAFSYTRVHDTAKECAQGICGIHLVMSTAAWVLGALSVLVLVAIIAVWWLKPRYE
ncbi:hypothetical protein PQR66_39515 [Paraburkholderia agricolaris]|uniref:Uncharacterized protein n=1 Tax=Paraburkholderia agricolaris TaxID=2152888 RepID=A0ABW9A1L9_9BURK